MIDTEPEVLEDHPYRSSFFYGRTGVVVGTLALLGGATALAYALHLFRTGGQGEYVLGLAILAYFVGGPGLYLVPQGVREVVRQRRAHQAKGEAQRWRTDYPWSTEGIRSPNAREVLWSAAVVAWMLPPIAASNTLFGAGGIRLKLFVIAADLAIAIGIVFTLHRTLRWLRHGTSYLAFDRFPFRPGESVDVHLRPAPSARMGEDLTAELRFVEERYGGSMQAEMVVMRTYSDTREVCIDPDSRAVADIPISIPLPPGNERVTRLIARPPCHWELCVRSRVPGVDFEALFLVPVYEA